MFIRLDTVPALDGQTDGQICRNNIVLYMHCMLTQDKQLYTATVIIAGLNFCFYAEVTVSEEAQREHQAQNYKAIACS